MSASPCCAAYSCAPAALKRAHKPEGGGGGAAAEPSEGTVIAAGAVDEMVMRCSARAGAMSRPRSGTGRVSAASFFRGCLWQGQLVVKTYNLLN